MRFELASVLIFLAFALGLTLERQIEQNARNARMEIAWVQR